MRSKRILNTWTRHGKLFHLVTLFSSVQMIKLSISSPFTKLQPHAIGRSAVTYEGEVLERKMKGEMPEFLPPCAPLTAACIVINTHLVLTCGNVGLNSLQGQP